MFDAQSDNVAILPAVARTKERKKERVALVKQHNYLLTKQMVEPEVRAGSNRSATKEENRQRYTDHGRGLSSTRDEEFEKRSDPDSSDSVGGSSHSERLADTSASFRTLCESLLRKELAELEMIKSREALRCEAEKRRMESEAEMTRMMMQTQLQIASFVEGMNSSRKRKRAEEDESRVSQREGALLLSMLQCNFIP